MSLSPCQLGVLRHYHRYGPTTTTQTRERCFPGDTTGRTTRRAHQRLRREDLIQRHTMEVVNPESGVGLPVHSITPRGREALSIELASDAPLVAPLSKIQPLHLFHATCVAEVYMRLDDAIARQDIAVLEESFREHEVVNVNEPDRKRQFSLFTLFSKKPRLVCQPDMAFELSVRGHHAAFYVEYETASSGARWVATRKFRGYVELAKRASHKLHFPTVTVDRPYVLAIGPTPNYRDALVRNFRNREGKELWRFACKTDITPESFLFEPIWYRVGSDDPSPLVKR